jgi:hypothetical protein
MEKREILVRAYKCLGNPAVLYWCDESGKMAITGAEEEWINTICRKLQHYCEDEFRVGGVLDITTLEYVADEAYKEIHDALQISTTAT